MTERKCHAVSHVVTIHDKTPSRVLAVGLREVLEVLEPEASRSWWVITELDCMGAEVQALCDDVDRARVGGRGGVVLSAPQLFDVARKTGQTLEAELYAVRAGAGGEVPDRGEDVRFLLDQRDDLCLSIAVIRGSEVEVSCRDAGLIARLKERFGDVREHFLC